MAIKTYKKGLDTKLSANFRVREFDCNGSGCCSQTKIDPQLVDYLQKIRDYFGKSVNISSGYRCPKHNGNVANAAKNSRHMQGMAADIKVSGIAPAAVAGYAESIGVRGIGLYEGADGNYYNTTETYVQLTFSREKSSPWYKKVAELEEEYYAEVNKQNAVMAQEPQKAKYLGFFSFLLVFTPLMPITLPLLIVNIVRQSKANKKYKQEHDEWINKKYSVNDAAARRKDELLEQASELVNA